jgi:uncharacterized protein (TIGR03435 family)
MRTIIAIAIAVVSVLAQATIAQQPMFDVASVKTNVSGNTAGWIETRPGGELVVRNQPLRSIIWIAHGVQESQLVGGPDWLAGERFDIVAKPASEPRSRDELMQMLQALLAERFNLVLHRETREAAVYALVPVRPGQLGAGARRSATDCDAGNAAAGRSVPPPGNAGLRPLCGTRRTAGRLMAGGVRLEELARNLSDLAGRTVIDATGITGFHDLDLEWQPELPASAAGALPAPASDAPSLFTALQEQLGLRLEPRRAPVYVLVIDAVERPTPD